ncbi:unnamed protein product [Auanema sp. JU1783]|nr:unnamed protein product [Auanema sp. JU1783]
MSTIASLTNYELVDIGANLSHPSFADDLEIVLERAQQAGITKIMLTGTSETISKDIVALAEKKPGFLYVTAGVHPHDAKDFNEDSLDVLRNLHKHPQCVAVGECGLDYNRNFSPPDVQRDVFRKQVELACDLHRPLFIHERDAHEDMVTILEEFKEKLPPAVIHCFTGTADQAKKYIEMGLYIGLTGFLSKDNTVDGVQFCLREGIIPLERLLLETDAPYMYPRLNLKKLPLHVSETITENAKAIHMFSSFKRNEPSSLAVICEMIASFMGKHPEQVARVTSESAKKIFSLD